MTSIIQSLISFNSYLFPFGAWIKTRETAQDLDITKMLGMDGALAPPGVLDAHIVTIEMPIGAMGDFTPESTLMDISYIMSVDDLNDALNRFFSQALDTGKSALTIGSADPPRTISAQYRGFKVNYMEGTGRRTATVAVDFYCEDPRWQDTTVKHLSAPGVATSDGNAQSYPIITYTQTGGAASVAPSLKVNPGGGSPYVQLTLNLTALGLPAHLQDGDIVVINCGPRVRGTAGIVITPSATGIPLNGLPCLGTTGIVNIIGNNATFPYLLPGTNDVTFAGASTIDFAWQDAYRL